MSSAKNIDWHKKCLKNSRQTSRSLRNHLKKEYDRLCKMERLHLFYELQIKEAQKQGKTRFDAERFMRKQKADYE